MHEDHAQDRAVEAETVEDPGDVDIDGQVRERLRQEEGQQDQAAEGQAEPRQGVAGGERDQRQTATVMWR